jgi:hypothetical protein
VLALFERVTPALVESSSVSFEKDFDGRKGLGRWVDFEEGDAILSVVRLLVVPCQSLQI